MKAAAGNPPSAMRFRRGRLAGPRAASIAVRLWSGLAALVLLLAGAATMINLGLGHKKDTVNDIVQRLHPLEVAGLDIRADFADAQSVLRAYLLTRQRRYLDIYHADRVSLRRAFRGAERAATGDYLASIEGQRRDVDRWFGYAARMEGLPPGSPQLARLTGAGFVSAGAFYTTNASLDNRIEAISRRSLAAGQRSVDSAALLGGVFAALAALLGLIAGW